MKENTNHQTGEGNAPRLIAAAKVDKWLNELRATLVERSEFKLADHVVSARVVIKMLEAQRDELLAALKLARPYMNGEVSIQASAAIAKASCDSNSPSREGARSEGRAQ